MENITFKNIHTISHLINENSLYKQYHYPEMPIRYDSNFIEFKILPSLAEFMETETYLREFHLKYGQKHVKFYFPENENPAKEILEYMHGAGYDVGFMELYAVNPSQFPAVPDNPDIEIQAVTDRNLEQYLKLQYEIDLQFGEEFAKQKVTLNKRNFSDENVMQVMALYQGTPVGSVDVIISETTAEIDGLEVNEAYRKKGIGSLLQKFVMDTFSDKTIILVADGEDTPREMYQKQNYQYLGFQYEAQKIYKEQ